MDSKKLETFVTSVDLGSFSKAAEVIGYTQSGITHMMDSLEKEVGFQLLERGRNGVTLTKEGERFMPAAREFLLADAALDNKIKEIREQKKDTISVAAYTSMTLHWLPDILYAFKRECPNIDVDLRMVDNALEPFDLLASGKTDVIFASKQDGTQCDWVKLYDEPMMAIIPNSFPLENDTTFPIKNFNGTEFLMPYGKFDIDVNAALEKYNVRPNIKQAHVDDRSIIRMVEHGLGVSMMAQLMISGDTDRVRCIPIEPRIVRELGIGVRSMNNLSEPVRKLIQTAVDHIPTMYQ